MMSGRDVEEKLKKSFTPEQTESLVAVLDDTLRQVDARQSADAQELRQALVVLAEAQARTEERVGRLEAAVERLVEAQIRTEEQIRNLAQAQDRFLTEQRLQEQRLGKYRGPDLEVRYLLKTPAFFGPLLRKVRVVHVIEIEDRLQGYLSEEELDDLFSLDLLVRGLPRRRPDLSEVWLAVEVSAVVDRWDVERAQRRAAALRRAGYRVVPTVAGEGITEGAEEVARLGPVLVLQDGRRRYWDEALQVALSA